MILYPAIDILGGKAVRLTKGDFEAKTVYEEEPLAAAAEWVAQGAKWLHVIDLDGAKAGSPANLEHLSRIATETGVPVQYGGGLRSLTAVEGAIAAGAERVILGTAIFSNPELLFQTVDTYGSDRVLVSLDVRDGYVATHGWLEATQVPAQEAIVRWGEGEAGVKRFVFTDIDHDGMLDGPNLAGAEALARAVGDGKLILSGGVGEIAHLQAIVRLRDEQQLDSLEGVIVGKALYEKRFTVAQAQAVLSP